MQFRKNVERHPEVYRNLMVPPACIDRRPVPKRGRVTVPYYDYKARCDYRHWISEMTFSEVYWTLKAIVQENFVVEKTALFTAAYVKQMPIEEFEKVQLQYTKNVSIYFLLKYVA